MAALEEVFAPSPPRVHDFRKTRAYARIREFLFRIDLFLKNARAAREDTASSEHTGFAGNTALPAPLANRLLARQLPPAPPDAPPSAPPLPAPLNAIHAIIEAVPLSTKPTRYTNLAMRTVIERICELVDDPHLRHSFGNPIRLDFGTGHELNFLCYLYRRFHKNKPAATPDDARAGASAKAKEALADQTTASSGPVTHETIALLRGYAWLIRRFVVKFNIEAAGARGGWSLDDYLLLPYLVEGHMGSADMLRMYSDEVLGRHVVTQHFIYTDELPV